MEGRGKGKRTKFLEQTEFRELTSSEWTKRRRTRIATPLGSVRADRGEGGTEVRMRKNRRRTKHKNGNKKKEK